MALEIAITLIGPYEFFNGVTVYERSSMVHHDFSYSFNSLMTVFSFCKTFFCLRAVMYLSKYSNPRAQRVCAMNASRANTMFALKSIIQEKPYSFLTIMFLVTSVIGGYFLHVFERPLS